MQKKTAERCRLAESISQKITKNAWTVNNQLFQKKNWEVEDMKEEEEEKACYYCYCTVQIQLSFPPVFLR